MARRRLAASLGVGEGGQEEVDAPYLEPCADLDEGLESLREMPFGL